MKLELRVTFRDKWGDEVVKEFAAEGSLAALGNMSITSPANDCHREAIQEWKANQAEREAADDDDDATDEQPPF